MFRIALAFASALLVFVTSACNPFAQETQPAGDTDGQPLIDPPPEGYVVATFAGGCFWCMERPFEELDGVLDSVSGYTDGDEPNPTYYEVSRGRTGHTEAVQVIYDPEVVTYEELLEVYWMQIDPTDSGGQFADRGSQYRPGIYFHTPEQEQAARASRDALEASGRFDEPIVVEIKEASAFYVAEDYHQNYYATNSAHYSRYRVGSGREGFIREHWGDDAAH